MKENKTETKKGAPRMRTIPQAYNEIKTADPHSGLSMRALRRMVSTGEIPSISIKSKKLINVDLLLDYLSCYNQYAIQAKWS